MNSEKIPSMGVFVNIFNLWIKHLNEKISSSALTIVNDGTCELQALLAQYIVLAGEKHRLMKESYLNNLEIEKQHELFKYLEDYLNETIENALGIVRKYLLSYYQERSNYQPRIIVKAPFLDNDIVDLFRKEQSPYPQFKAIENSAFESIKDNGKYYLCNNIPETIKKGGYNNKRINISAVKQNYTVPGIFKKLIYKCSGQPERDIKWETFWDNNRPKRPIAESCYKSTLVVPMTLVNANLRTEFKDYIFGTTLNKEEGNYQKLMFAFLCIDHRHTDYFNSNQDIKVGYIFADLISLFLVTRSMYSSKSKTFNAIYEALNIIET